MRVEINNYQVHKKGHHNTIVTLFCSSDIHKFIMQYSGFEFFNDVNAQPARSRLLVYKLLRIKPMMFLFDDVYIDCLTVGLTKHKRIHYVVQPRKLDVNQGDAYVF